MDGDVAASLVVVGASAGGVEALVGLVSGLPEDFPGCVLVVLHVPATAGSALPSILDRAGKLPARHARDGDRLTVGTVLVAPPDRHLVVHDGVLVLSRGPQENGHRPAVDVLFRSAARAWGRRVTGIVLSGALDDGAAGAVAVRSRGGRCLVQDPDEALYADMPRATLAVVPEAEVLGVRAMPDRLGELTAAAQALEEEATDETGPLMDPLTDPLMDPLMDKESGTARMDPEALHDPDRPGHPSGFGCPDCAGALFEIDEGDLRRYRCRVGHAWSPESLLARQGSALEGALWMALRGLEEKAALHGQLHERAVERGARHSAERFERGRVEVLRAAELVRRMLTETTPEGDPLVPEVAVPAATVLPGDRHDGPS